MNKLFDRIKKGAKWEGKDHFPSNIIWKTEIIRWLEFASAHGQYDRYLSRLRDMPEKRDEALAEIIAAYYLTSYMSGCKIIEWEPRNKSNKTGEYVFEINGQQVFCEIKRPSWKAAVVRDQGYNSGRLLATKFLPSLEIRSYDNSTDIRKAIRKAYHQLSENMPNLLIIVDDLFASNKENNYFGVNKALFVDQLKSPPYAFDIHYSWLKSFGKKQEKYWKLLIENEYINEYGDCRGRILSKFTGRRIDFSIQNINKQDEDNLFSVIETVNPKGYFTDNFYARLSAVACLNVVNYFSKNEIAYYWKMFDNPFTANKISSIQSLQDKVEGEWQIDSRHEIDEEVRPDWKPRRLVAGFQGNKQ